MGDKQGRWRLIEIVISFMLTVSLALAGWCGSQIIAHERELAEMKASRFTSKDGLEVWKEISGLKETIAKIDHAPPQWFADKVSRLEQHQEADEKAMSDLREIVHENAVQLKTFLDGLKK